jgi:type II secretory pathway component PulJ
MDHATIKPKRNSSQEARNTTNETEIQDLRKATAEHLRQIAQLNGQVFVLQRIVSDLVDRYNHHTHEKQEESYFHTLEPNAEDQVSRPEF